ncbi:MAG TPA: hypothetical protein V6C91_18375 [Coleofasciculaceae cyanobacterium]
MMKHLVSSLLNLDLLNKAILIAIVCLLASAAISPAIAQPSQTEINITQSPSRNSPPNNQQLPAKVKSAVLQDAVQRTSRPVAAFRIVEAQKRTWPNGCLGLSQPGTFCTQVIVPGWQVVVTDGQRRLTYRTNNSGSTVKLENRSSK